MTMSRIQNILDKAERDGTVLRTSRIGVPATATAAAPASVAVAAAPPVSASVPVTIDIPTPPVADAPAVIVPGGPATPHATVTVPVTPSAPGNSGDAIMHYTVRLNPLLVAGLSPKSLAAEQYRQLRTRLAHAEGAQNLRTVLVTSPQKGEGKSITSANLALTMAQELHRRADDGAGPAPPRPDHRSRSPQAVAAAPVRTAGRSRVGGISVGRRGAERR